MGGIVYLVGAGPGDPGLITVRGRACLRRADVVIADRLAPRALLEDLRPDVELLIRGARRSTLEQDDINRLLIEHARRGKIVVRLKGGDPFLFGRGGEEAEALRSAGVPFEVVPGVTAALAAPAYAGIPLTHRGVAVAVTFATGHESEEKIDGHADWRSFADPSTTLVLYMSVTHLDAAMQRLVRVGRDPSTPVALIVDGTRSSQRTIVGTISDIAAKGRAAGVRPPALTIVGEVVRLRESLSWFERRPLHGTRVLVTRSASAAPPTVQRLEALGADVIAVPTIEIRPPSNHSAVDAAIARLDRYRLIAFASANGVDGFMKGIHRAQLDARSLAGKIIASVGENTAAALAAHGLRSDVVAGGADSTGSGLGGLLTKLSLSGGPALLPRAEEGRDDLERALRGGGIETDTVAVYRTAHVPLEGLRDPADRLAAGEVDAVTFGSPRTAQALLSALPDPRVLGATIVAAIGPTTAEFLRAAGVRVDVVPARSTFDALVDDLIAPLVARISLRR